MNFLIESKTNAHLSSAGKSLTPYPYISFLIPSMVAPNIMTTTASIPIVGIFNFSSNTLPPCKPLASCSKQPTSSKADSPQTSCNNIS
jgi:hypothetical protein